MDAAELRALTDEELVERIEEVKTEWRDLRFDEAVGRLTNSMRIREIKREIARIKTIQTERQMAKEIEKQIAT
ncbi:MAG: 50S ribosomal protein L29 [Sphaerobacteraceae bacterium]|nr:MAG: 50S ribosomal protein L29 [Sphaerobacteraceae bacterium]